MSEQLKQVAAITALNNMLGKGYFDICTIDNVGKLLGRRPSGDAYNVLHALHCIHYDKMPKELRDQIPQLIRECLDVEPAFQFELPPEPKRTELRVIEPQPEQKQGFLRRLLP